MPLNLANPAWVDAEPDLKQHIVEIKLESSAKAGAGMAELEAAVSKLHPDQDCVAAWTAGLRTREPRLSLRDLSPEHLLGLG